MAKAWSHTISFSKLARPQRCFRVQILQPDSHMHVKACVSAHGPASSPTLRPATGWGRLLGRRGYLLIPGIMRLLNRQYVSARCGFQALAQPFEAGSGNH